ncbi:MAG: hypothetical protein K0Q94_6385, partial [Paenibacillus sp.]|nr:hypothetical protein [Paenibacillus sp.]
MRNCMHFCIFLLGVESGSVVFVPYAVFSGRRLLQFPESARERSERSEAGFGGNVDFAH